MLFDCGPVIVDSRSESIRVDSHSAWDYWRDYEMLGEIPIGELKAELARILVGITFDS